MFNNRRGVQSLSTKVAVWMSLISIIIFASISMLQYHHMKQTLTAKIEQELQLKAASIADQVEAFFCEQAALVQAMAANQDIRNFLRTTNTRDEVDQNPYHPSVQKTLDDLMEVDEKILYTYTSSEQGKFNVGNDDWLTPPEYNVHSRPWYQAAINHDTYVITEAYLDTKSGNLVVTIAQAVREEGKVLGTVAIDIELSVIPQIMNSEDLGELGYAFLLGENGQLVYHPNEEYILKPLDEVNHALEIYQEKMVHQEEDLQTIEMEGEAWFFGYAPVPISNWSVGSMINKGEALVELQSFTLMSFLYSVCGIGILVAVLFIFIKRTLRVIPQMVDDVEQIASGDLTREFQVERKDEVGRLSAALNSMTAGLNHIVQTVNQSATKVSDASCQLDQTTQKTVQSTEEVTEVIQEIAKATEMQATTTEQGAMRIQELAERMEFMGETIAQITARTNETAELSNDGMKTIEELQHWFHANQQATTSIGQIIQEVEQSSQAISGIIDVINQITSQTNLLSLNASIEAARVGEAGSGFAIVAQEIRTLSEQTAQATEGIYDQIAHIQGKAQEAVQVFVASEEAVTRNGEAVQATGKTFGYITDTVQTLNEQVEHLSALSGEMEERKNNILDVIQQISASAEENSAATEEVSASSQEQLRQIEQMSLYTQQLEEASRALATVMGTFKIK